MKTRHFYHFIFWGLLSMSSCVCTRGWVREKQPSIPYGGVATTIARHPRNENEFIVASEKGGLFKTRNGGEKWEQISENFAWFFYDIHYYKENPNILLVTTLKDWRVKNAGGIWRSTNGGRGWNKISIGTPEEEEDFKAYAINEDSRNRIYLGTSRGLAYSDDAGETWAFNTSLPQIDVYAVLTSGAFHIKVMGRGGIYRSQDGGVTWLSPSNIGVSPDFNSYPSPNQIAVSPYNDNHIFWAGFFNDNSPSTDYPVAACLYFSSDNGVTWVKKRPFTRPNQPPFVVISDAIREDRKYALFYGNGYKEPVVSRLIGMDGAETPGTGTWSSITADHVDARDLAFKLDGYTPALLTTDGGVHATSTNGNSWDLVGSGRGGFNALEITDVAGQIQRFPDQPQTVYSQLYFSTWHNSFWASRDEGINWLSYPDEVEGNELSTLREIPETDKNKVLGYVSGVGYFISKPLFDDLSYFPYANPRGQSISYIKPGYYIQPFNLADGQEVYRFYYTSDYGHNWSHRFYVYGAPRKEGKLAGSVNNPTYIFPKRFSGATPDGTEVVGLARINNVLSDAPIVSDITGFGNLGYTWKGQSQFYVFGVNPHNPNHIIVTDVIDNCIRVTRNGGITWEKDGALTDSIIQATHTHIGSSGHSGKLLFSYGTRVQVTSIEFDPDREGFILVGTEQSGIFRSCDNGKHWYRVPNSTLIPSISAFHFLDDGKAIVSSAGRGLWQVPNTDCPEGIDLPDEVFDGDVRRPAFYKDGVLFPLHELVDVGDTSGHIFHLVRGGEITGIQSRKVKDLEELAAISISSGKLESMLRNGETKPSGFEVRSTSDNSSIAQDKMLTELLKKGYKIKGILTRNTILMGFLLSSVDIDRNNLPKPHVPQRTLEVQVTYDSLKHGLHTLMIYGSGFIPSSAVILTIDTTAVLPPTPYTADADGNIRLRYEGRLATGLHHVLAEQEVRSTIVREATSFIIQSNEFELSERE